jgi:hypothetical protein
MALVSKGVRLGGDHVDFPFLEREPEAEEAPTFFEDQRLSFFFTVLNLRRYLKVSWSAGVIVTDVSTEDSLGVFLSH